MSEMYDDWFGNDDYDEHGKHEPPRQPYDRPPLGPIVLTVAVAAAIVVAWWAFS